MDTNRVRDGWANDMESNYLVRITESGFDFAFQDSQDDGQDREKQREWAVRWKCLTPSSRCKRRVADGRCMHMHMSMHMHMRMRRRCRIHRYGSRIDTKSEKVSFRGSRHFFLLFFTFSSFFNGGDG